MVSGICQAGECRLWSSLRGCQGQIVELRLSLQENFSSITLHFFFLCHLLTLKRDTALLSSLRANCKACWVGNKTTLGFGLVGFFKIVCMEGN